MQPLLSSIDFSLAEVKGMIDSPITKDKKIYIYSKDASNFIALNLIISLRTLNDFYNL